ncbi:MATE family efflux transporter [Natrarchaeobius oligotrophus]|uniref:MATE family efflux transporter n=1 Tax=Natrarchaeobius oligotrophus TaxID=3455743 RepID=UPI001FB3DC65|nr:MATE family efflux transporter [Natrarchaeobius chitinivorans]
MFQFGDRLLALWRRSFSLGWPIAVQQTLNTLMRTVDVVVTGLFSPAAVAAIGLGDLYARIPLRIGMGLGSGAIALSSQETGRGSDDVRDRAITQALLVGALCGVPLALAGLLFGHALIAALGAESEVVRLGGTYLMIVFAAAPMRIVGLVGARSLQGTGDTRTPMVVNASANGLNILLSVGLGLGVWLAPTLSVVGVGIATAVSRTVEALLLVGAIGSDRTGPSLARPTDLTITRQLFAISAPSIAGGVSNSLANFPFNALVLLFGTEANAAYHIANRMYQQLSGPLYRAFRTVSSIVVGQELGAGRPTDARYSAKAIAALSVATLGFSGVVTFLGAEQLALLFSRDATTVEYATEFIRAFAVSMVFIGVYFPLSGSLTGAGDTRTPLYAQLVGSYAFMLAGSYLLAVTLGYGLVGVYAGIVLSYAARAAIVAAGFQWGGWEALAARMLSEREKEHRRSE